MDDENTNDENVYADKGREEMVDNDEISPEEEGFMKGYDNPDEEESEDADSDQEEDELY